jgi:tricorn protease
MYKVSTTGEGVPTPLSIPRIFKGKYSPNGNSMVYQLIYPWESEWRNYRGGQNKPLRIINLKNLKYKNIPWDNSNDKDPVWVDNKIFFLSDRDYAMNIWSYDTKTKQINQVTHYKEFDCKNLEAGGGKLIFENGGYLYTLNAKGGTPIKLSINVKGDFPWMRPQWKNVGRYITDAAISPTGKRAVFSARGEIFTVPAKKGDVRNLTQSSGAADREPAWSPDGKNISWFSDEGGEYQLVIADQFGKVQNKYKLENPTFYYSPVWSPDSKYISYGDADRNLWVLDVNTGISIKIDNENFSSPERFIYPEWAPDSKWIAYTKRLKSEYKAIFVYSLDQKKSYQISDGMSDCISPAWDKSGKYLYFLASTNYALNVGWLDMSRIERPIRRAVYMAVLSKDEPSPLAPESDEEVIKEEKSEKDASDKKKKKKESEGVRIDFEGLSQRIIALDIPSREYLNLATGKEGVIFYDDLSEDRNSVSLHRYKIKDRKADKLLDGLVAFRISFDRNKLLYMMANRSCGICSASGKPNPGKDRISTNDLQALIDPGEECKQMFREAWRYQRDFFYVDNVHGLDLDWAYKTYSTWVDDVAHRSDMNYLLDILSGETAIGHSFVYGGDYPRYRRVPIGLLGADYKIKDNRYVIKKIYNGENWNPGLRAPLSGPGINIKEGEYVLAVNGKPLYANKNIYSMFDETANKQIKITVNSKPTMQGARDVTVVPVRSEQALRQYDWIEGNRRMVDKLSGGKLAYVWLPNTGYGGYNNFNRYYFAQKDKKGAIIDERFNRGGLVADYIVDLLSRDLMGYFNNPVGDRQAFTSPDAGIWGPKVMVINEQAGSGGDILPYMFKKKKIGPLVGTRTWGGLVGIWDVPDLIDGGHITAPRGGFYNTNGEWDIENKGVAPDVEVEQNPAMVSKGHDTQLEKAVEVALHLLKKEEIKLKPQPKDPIRVKRPE